jgi:hypothetical protein
MSGRLGCVACLREGNQIPLLRYRINDAALRNSPKNADQWLSAKHSITVNNRPRGMS